jgi:hypothetical protein
VSDNGSFTYMPFAQVPTRAAWDKRLTESDLRVLIYLASLTVNSNRRAWMAQQKMADRLDIHVSTVKRSLRRLRKLRYIRVESNGRKGPARRNRYYILHEASVMSEGMWDVEGERTTFEGPLAEHPVGSTRRPQLDANGSTAAPIMGAPGGPQEREGSKRNSPRKNPYGREPSSRESEVDAFVQVAESVTKDIS